MFVPYSTGVLIVGKSQTDSLREEAFFPTGGSAVRVAIRDSLVFVASGLAGLWVLDISNPQQPRNISNVNTGGNAAEVIVADNFAYVVNYPLSWADDSSRGLWIIDVSNPSQPRIVRHYVGIVRFSGTGVPNIIAKLDELIFVTQIPTTGNDSVVEIIDISVPDQPARLGTIRGTYRPYDVAAKDSILYVAASDSGLLIFDIHEPSSPRRLLQFGTLGSYPYWGVAVVDSYAYVDRIDTLFVANISNPSSPTVVGKFGRNYGSFSNIDLSVAYPFVYWAERSLGAIDVSDPARPVERARFSGYDWIDGVAAKGNIVAATDASQGVWILRNDLLTSVDDKRRNSFPESFELYQNYPNPFNAQTTSEFFVPTRGLVTLEVFNLLGQKVSTLFSGNAESGTHTIIFDASRLSSGLYFYRATNKEGSVTRKMMLLK
jgi:hypothetical protein